MPTNLAMCLEYLFPGAVPDLDYEIRDEGGGPYIAWWELPEPEPTQAELEAAWIPALKEQKERELILAADVEEKAIWTAEIEFKYVLIRRMMGQTISASQQEKAKAVLAIFVKLEEKITQVRQAMTEAELEAVKWTA